MSDHSKIEWTDATWTPIRAAVAATEKIGWHCEHVSPGCEHCYAETLNRRLGTGLPFKPGHRKDVQIYLDEKMLTAPLRWRRPRMIFVCSMTDLFAEFVPDEWIDRMFAVMALSPQHKFQLLSKRSARMKSYCSQRDHMSAAHARLWHAFRERGGKFEQCPILPLPNVWLGVSVEDQQRYDERVGDLRATPAAVHFFSFEPLLGPIHADYLGEWCIVGCESGAGFTRPLHPDWARAVRDQCQAAGTK